ncbi:hypothetical protein LMORI2_00820 [Limnohabitans sp. MORI2]|jgi:hypothetical protein|uniref:hypothetical protein n=1 Tax=Limnohabitans sp. MORI2 TaxID=1751150 RepID=UPI0023777C0E|nr:hypothetical protein [Limnohabitans sp. MORI2]BDU57100.1 hypothetical protein LMORI2_00820 [Limnohabitans sp. MORI2]
MKPRILIAIFFTLASISSAAMLFLDKPNKSLRRANELANTIEIKWGEGSEAGVPEILTKTSK